MKSIKFAIAILGALLAFAFAKSFDQPTYKDIARWPQIYRTEFESALAKLEAYNAGKLELSPNADYLRYRIHLATLGRTDDLSPKEEDFAAELCADGFDISCNAQSENHSDSLQSCVAGNPFGCERMVLKLGYEHPDAIAIRRAELKLCESGYHFICPSAAEGLWEAQENEKAEKIAYEHCRRGFPYNCTQIMSRSNESAPSEYATLARLHLEAGCVANEHSTCAALSEYFEHSGHQNEALIYAELGCRFDPDACVHAMTLSARKRSPERTIASLKQYCRIHPPTFTEEENDAQELCFESARGDANLGDLRKRFWSAKLGLWKDPLESILDN